MRLPLSVLFEQPTVEHLASAVREKRAESSRTTMTVPVQPAGSRPPLFCMHFAEEVFIAMRHLIPALGPDQPVFGLWTPQLVAGDWAGRIEDVAASSITAMREVQPHGPYFLFGYSMGGVVAWEMARQLGANADDVRLVALVDTACPGTAPWWRWFVRQQLNKTPREAAMSALRRIRSDERALRRRSGKRHTPSDPRVPGAPDHRTGRVVLVDDERRRVSAARSSDGVASCPETPSSSPCRAIILGSCASRSSTRWPSGSECNSAVRRRRGER